MDLKRCVTCRAYFPEKQDSDQCVPCRKAENENLINCFGCGFLVDGLAAHRCPGVDKDGNLVENLSFEKVASCG